MEQKTYKFTQNTNFQNEKLCVCVFECLLLAWCVNKLVCLYSIAPLEVSEAQGNPKCLND